MVSASRSHGRNHWFDPSSAHRQIALAGIDDATVTFGDAPDPIGDASIAQKKGHFQDVNGDGYVDKVSHFPFVETNLDPTDTEGCLGGEVGGFDFAGCDSVNIVPG